MEHSQFQQVRRNVPREEVTGDKEDRATAMFVVQDVHVGKSSHIVLLASM